MASTRLKFSYRRLRKGPPDPEEDGGGGEAAQPARAAAGGRGRRRRPRVRIARLRCLLRRQGVRMRASLRRVVGRLNEARSHFGELFSGNYVFMQVNPAPVGKAFAAAHGGAHPPSGYYLPRVG
ncbi:unnamed protein product [Spirodela intermedia]|uniref:Uncharacterized protein n=1 Tax=Spirodela intermedia TaxID=51605 RepID=A0A7I8KEE4_SPIIN|nr:unnamed protein product [Spirodela intermedia]